MITDNAKLRWYFYLGWVVLHFAAMVAAWYIAWAIISQITNLVGGTIQVRGQTHITEDFLLIYVLFPTIGLLTGILQYILLRRALPHMAWWIAATFFGWLMPFAAGFLIITLLNGRNDPFSIMIGLFLIGTVMAVPQWWLLRKRVRYAAWWILAHAVGWSVAGLFSLANSEALPVLLALALLPAIATGFTLWLLLERLPARELKGSISSG